MADHSNTWGLGDEGFEIIPLPAPVVCFDVTIDGVYAFLANGAVFYIPKGSMLQPQVRHHRPRE